MSFRKLLKETLWLLLAERQISYRRLALEFELDDATLEGLRHELIQVKRVATDQDGEFLVWAGTADSATSTATSSALAKLEPLTPVRENMPSMQAGSHSPADTTADTASPPAGKSSAPSDSPQPSSDAERRPLDGDVL